jgi:hypothetical protein
MEVFQVPHIFILVCYIPHNLEPQNAHYMSIQITPDNAVALPDKQTDDVPDSAREAVEVSSTTAMVLQELGMGFDMTPEDEEKANALFAQLTQNGKNKNLPVDLNTPEIAARVGGMLKAYDHQVVADAVQLRTVITNKLILLADCGDTKYELKALELLGKIQDVGLFSEKSEVTVIHKTSEDLEKAIRDKVRRLIHSNTIDVEPIVDDLEAELGVKPEEPDASPDVTGVTEPTGDPSEPA